MSSAEDVVQRYNDAWNERDPDRCRELIEATWAEDAVIADPNGDTKGREALFEYVQSLQKDLEGFHGSITSPVEESGGRFRFSWEVKMPDGRFVAAGTDFGELAADGRIQRLTVFIDKLGESPG